MNTAETAFRALPTRGGGRSSPPVLRVGPVLLSFVLSGALPGPIASQEAATLRGTIVDATTEGPVGGVVVGLVGTDVSMTTTADGVFFLTGITAGRYMLLVRGFGYQPRGFEFEIAEHRYRTLDVGSITLQTQTFELDDIVVEEEGGLGMMEPFYARVDRGFGNFITRADIEKRDPIMSTDMLRTIPGVEVSCDRGDCQVAFARMNRPSGPTIAGGLVGMDQMTGLGDSGSRIGRSRDNVAGNGPSGNSLSSSEMCPITYFVDGLPYHGRGINEITPKRIEGIEIYKGPAATPPQFARYGASCGVIAVWTRRP